MKPYLGQVVLYRRWMSNGVGEHPAIVTRVWSDTCINVIVFPDCGDPIVRTSVIFNEDIEDTEFTHGWR